MAGAVPALAVLPMTCASAESAQYARSAGRLAEAALARGGSAHGAGGAGVKPLGLSLATLRKVLVRAPLVSRGGWIDPPSKWTACA
jgi:hypothetical protein